MIRQIELGVSCSKIQHRYHLKTFSYASKTTDLFCLT